MTEFPSGTVTFLFTDIEGSTLLERELREQYSEVLAEHRRLLREAFKRYDGHEVDTQGDSFFVVFPRARDAVAAAVAAQRALLEHTWPDGLEVRVRIGMHTGEASLDDGRYVGLAVHRGARIAAAGHGGQILLSSSTRDVVEDDLPAGQRLVDLGEQRLKDLPRPERVFQLLTDGLPTKFPPLKTVDEQELADAAAAAVGRFQPVRRRPLLAAGLGAVLIVGVVVAAVLVIGGGSKANASGIAANSVGLLNADSGSVEQQVAVASAPTGVAVGDGAIWVTNTNDACVSRVDPETHTVRQTIPVGNSPSGIAVGAGSVWVANHDDGTLSRIDPATNTLVQTIRVGNGPTAVAFGQGSVWVTNADDRTLTQINPMTGTEAPKSPIRTDAVSRGVAVGAGSVWVTDESTKTVARVDPGTGEVADTVNVGNGPTGIAYGAGSVWVANSLDGTVSRIDPGTVSVTATIRVGNGPAAVVAGIDAVWASVEFANRVVKIDPAGSEPRIAATLEVGNRPKGLAASNDGVWVAVQESGRNHRGGRLVVNAPGLAAIDPAYAGSPYDVIGNGLVYDGLTAVRRSGGADGTQVVPDLAETLPAPTNGGTTYTFRLRRGVRYSNGRVVRAEDFRRGLERVVANNTAGAVDLKVIGGAQCTTKHCDLSRGVITGKDSVTIRLSEPNPRLPLLLSGVAPAPPGTPLEAVPLRSPAGTGPYMVESFVPGRGARFVRNPHFRVLSPAARPDGYPDEIVWRLVDSEDKAVAAVVHGEADVLPLGSPQKRIAELKTRYASLLHPVPQKATTFLFLNTRQPPFDDVRVRRAVNFAVDRAKMAALHGGSELATPACQLVPPSLPGFVPYCPYTVSPDSTGAWKAPDLERAQRLVAASGTRGDTVVVWTFPYFGPEGRYAVSLLRRLGYRARLKEIRTADRYFATITKTHPLAGFAGWFSLLLPSDVLGTLVCGEPQNWADFCDRSYDRRLARLRREEVNNPEAAARLTKELEREAVDKAPWAPLLTPQLVDVVSKRVGNYQSNPYNGILLDQLWVR